MHTMILKGLEEKYKITTLLQKLTETNKLTLTKLKF